MSILDTIFRFPANDIGTANITEPQFTKGFAGELNAASKLVFENDLFHNYHEYPEVKLQFSLIPYLYRLKALAN